MVQRERIDQGLIDAFHRHWYEEHRGPWLTKWRGVPMVKNPFDLLVYAEIVHEVRPDTIIETGTHLGGSALFLADLCAMEGNGIVITIDTVVKERRPLHDRISYLTGNSLEVPVLPYGRTIVILDSDHSKEHVLAELRRFAGMVSVGSYLIVEDTNVGNPIEGEEGDPMSAVAQFLAESKGPRFIADISREKYLLTSNPSGYLKRTA